MGCRYSLQWLPGVLLLAATGVLDTFRVLLLQPIFDKVLRPDAPEGPILLGITGSRLASNLHFDLRTLIPHFMHSTMPGTWWPLRWLFPRWPRAFATISALIW